MDRGKVRASARHRGGTSYTGRREITTTFAISLLSRAKKAGYTALFVTLETYVLGWRPSDMDNR